MDLRTIMNSDAAASSAKPSDSVYPPRDQPAPSSTSYPSAYPHTSPERSSSYGSLQSPYQYHHPPPPPYGSSTSRDPYPAPGPYNNNNISSIPSSSPPSTRSSIRNPSIAPQPYPSQLVAQPSMPMTPRGSSATAAAAPFPRHTPPSGRPQSSGHDTISNQGSSPWVGPDAPLHRSPDAVPRVSRQDSRPLDFTPRQLSTSVDRRASDDNVSPKSALPPSHSRQGSALGAYPDQIIPPQQSTPVENDTGARERRPSIQSSYAAPSASQTNSSPTARGSIAHEVPVEALAQTAPVKVKAEPGATTSSPHAPKVKRRRYHEPPIYARRSVRTKGRCPMIQNQLPPIPKHARNSAQNPWILRQRSVSSQAPPSTVDSSFVKTKAETPPVNGPSVPSQAPEGPQTGSLGPWEPSITGYIPYEEVTKLVCDFLFQHVVLRNDAIAAAASSSAAGQGAIIEIEAKLGQLVDMDRGERLHLPILTESVVNRENSRLRTAFESTMTVAQHRAMNNFLNEAVKASIPHSNQGRIPLSYAHKKERDTFYEVSPSDLPPVIRQNLNPRHKPRVRVTVDQRSGEVLAKIVKCRVADLDVYSPHTCVDWRISVNLEMSYEGDVQHLPVIDGSRGRGGERNKDRMSYRHLAYQVDLTQVAKSESSKGDFEHELEIEVSAAEIRRQGQLAMAGDPKNQYEDLVKGFVDNIRVLARAVPP
ncbi:putative mRNA capping nucleoside-triphosphatase [Aspergillus tanneri]|uniref:mRNA-capping enzyme subunit beta n=1 Tax=Aspergillus tanneri TaxID=1220188 RepID=A0A5M9MQ20_9EURO|nr:mRNA-capping enzyme subunit beta [Aspergillus tanneri]KAA8648988.1 mRNA-capping enzyme subunit beta [Aspergillus tanneri]